jgi:transposase
MPHLSDIDKARVVSHLENGRPITNLAAEFGVGKSSIYRIKNKWEIERSVRRKAGSGRPKASNEQQDEELLKYRVSQNWLPRENRHVPTTKETLN